jgi:glycosyltransferase involved in cell wall biosynthesis
MGVPPSVSAFVSIEMRDKVKELIESGKYDAILLFDMNAIQFCPSSCYDKLIVHIEDPLSIKGYRLLGLPVVSSLAWIKLFIASKVASIYEKRVFPLMAKVLLLSESDKQDLYEQGLYNNLGFVPYGVDQKDAAEIVAYEQREKVIVFSGNMFHLPNVDGALFFLRDIFPLILRQYSSVVLWIVGDAPDARIYAAASKFGKHVIITGRVDDIAGYIKRATVSICPVRLKIGVQTKILEALSWGTPVVTTSAGRSGIEGLSGSHFWIEDDPQQFANRVVEILQGIGWSKLSEGGRWLAEKKFSWEGSKLQLERYLETVISRN